MTKLNKTVFPVLVLLLLFTDILPLMAQDGYKKVGGKIMGYYVEGKDTVFFAPLQAAHVYEKKKRMKGRAWRKYYRLVHNFAVVYPYALVAKDVVMEVDSTIKAKHLKYIRKELYVTAITKELFGKYEKTMRNMTVSQGQLLMRLIDRECGIDSYTIIKDFKNRYAAGFWQVIAKVFGSDLKKRYEPEGIDAPTEELVQQWEKGTFEQTYFEIFWKYPPSPDFGNKTE